MRIANSLGTWLLVTALCMGGSARAATTEVTAALGDGLAATALERGEYTFAANRLLDVARQSGADADYATAARMAFDYAQYAVLRQLGDVWVARSANDESAHRYRALAALELDQRTQAVIDLAWLLEHAYTTPDAAFESLGHTLSVLHNRAGVAAVMGTLAQRYPASAQAALAVGQAALAAADSEHAVTAARRASTLGRARVARSLEARARIIAGDCDEGLALAVPVDGQQRDADRLSLAWLLIACERDAEAEPMLQALAARGSAQAGALEALAGRELAARRLDAAEQHYAALSHFGSFTDAQFGLASVQEARGDNAQAIASYASVTSGEKAVAAQIHLYRLRLQSGDADFADRMLDEFAADNPPLRRELVSERVLALAQAGNVDAAIALVTRARQAYPDAEELVRAHAEVLAQSGRRKDAIAVLEQLLARRPEDPAAQNALGYTLAEANLQLDRADRLIRAACAQSPDRAAYLDSAGWLAYRRHQWPLALAALHRAYRLQRDPQIAAHLVQALYAAGDGAGAAQVLQAALVRDPTRTELTSLGQQHGVGAP